MFDSTTAQHHARAETVSCIEGGAMKMVQGNAAVATDLNADLLGESLANTGIKTERPIAMGSGALEIGGAKHEFDYEVGAPVGGRSEIRTSGRGGELSVEHGVLTKFGIAALAAWASVSAMAKNVTAAIIPSGGNDASYIQSGASNAGLLLSLQATLPNGALEHTSAMYLDPWDVITAAHNLTGLTGSAVAATIQIGTSPNYNNPSAGVVVTASSYVIEPNYVRGSSAATTPDIAIVHLSSPLPSINAHLSQTAPSVSQMIEYGGYGLSSEVSGNPTASGDGRAWYMPTEDGAPAGESDTYYMAGRFSPAYSGQLNANAYGGDSGGAVFSNLNGEVTIYGSIVAQTGGTGSSGDTTFINFAQPEIREFIVSNSSVPEPGSIAFLVSAAVVVGARRARE